MWFLEIRGEDYREAVSDWVALVLGVSIERGLEVIFLILVLAYLEICIDIFKLNKRSYNCIYHKLTSNKKENTFHFDSVALLLR